MIKAIIFDLNGVFIQSPKLSDRFQDQFGISSQKFFSALKDIMNQIRQPGAGDAFSHWKPYFSSWNIQLSEEEFFKFWFDAEKAVPELIDLAENIKNKGVQLFILSNNFKERAAYYKTHFSFLDSLFKKIYYSWETGFVKPSRESLQLILDENQIQADECLFFDDREENIKIATELGIHAYLFHNFADLKTQLAKYSL